MNTRLRTALPLAAIALFPGAALAGGNLKARAPLVRPSPAPDDDARGRIDMTEKADDAVFRVRLEKLDVGAAFSLFVEDSVGAGTFTDAGAFELDGDEFDLRFDSSEGPLPLGVAALSDLVGRLVQVQSASVVHLTGVVPDFAAKGKGSGGWLKGKRALMRSDDLLDDDAKGTLEVRTKPADNRDRFVVKAQRLPTGSVASFIVYIEDAPGSTLFVPVAEMAADDDDPKDRVLKIDTHGGAPLPLGVFDVEELEGFGVEVRGSDGNTYLQCQVPAFHEGKKKQQKGKAKLQGPGGKVDVEVRSHASAPDESLELEGELDLASAAMVDVYLQHPSTGIPDLVATVPADGKGRFKLKISTKSGAALPYFVCDVATLAGLEIEFREFGQLETLVSGAMPDLK